MRSVIVSAADEHFFGLLQGTVSSVMSTAPVRPPITVLDCGLTPKQKEWLASKDVSIVVPDWDFEGFDFPGSWFKAMTARPHLPKWVPGFDIYLWIDADAWVQDWSAVTMLLEAATAEGVACVPESDRGYPETVGKTPDRHVVPVFQWRFGVLAELFGKPAAQRLAGLPTLNCGAFAVRADSQLWDRWSDAMRGALQHAKNPFFAEQTAFNLVLYEQIRTFARLPAWCNWVCNRALPLVDDRGRLLETGYPYHPLGIVHMTGDTKRGTFDLPRLGGGVVRRALTYPGGSGDPIHSKP